jgi:hypothetical protein
MLVPALTVYVETVIRREPVSQKGGGSKGNVLPCNMLCMISAIDHSSLSDVKWEGSRMSGRWGGLSRKDSVTGHFAGREDEAILMMVCESPKMRMFLVPKW